MFGLDPDTLRNIKLAFAKIPDIDKVILYGSRAKGNYHNGSDIDITLLGKNLTLSNSVYPLMDELEELYLPYMFDISVFSAIDNEKLVGHINRAGKVFYQRKKSLPKGWEVKKLGEVCDLQNGFAFKSKDYIDYSNTINFRMSQIRPDGNIDLENNPKYLPNNYAIKYKEYLLKEGDIVIAMTDMATETKILGVPTILPKDHRNWLLNQRVGKLFDIDSSKIDVVFLKYILNSETINRYYKKLGRGGLQINIGKKDILNVIIPLPPLPEQKRIVAILDQAFTAIAKAKANTEQNLKNARELFQSALQTEFVNGKSKIKNGEWQEKKLGEVCEIFAGGDVPKNNLSKIKTKKYNIPIFSNGVKNDGLYGYTDIEKVIEASITISARGTIGYSSIRKESFYPVVRLIVLTPKNNLLNLYFLWHVTRDINFTNSGSSIPQLTVPMIKKYRIPLPPLPEQKRIVKKLDALSTETKKLETIYQQKINDLDELKKSILQKAFSGEL